MLKSVLRYFAGVGVEVGLLVIVLVGRAGASLVVVDVVDGQAGRGIVGARVARLVGKSWIKANNSLQTVAMPVGATDAKGEIRLDADPAERSAFFVAAAGKAPRVFGFWGCVPSTYRVALSDTSAVLSGTMVDSEGKPVTGARVRISFADYEFLEAVRLFNVPNIGLSMEVTTDEAGRFRLLCPPAIPVNEIAVESKGEWQLAGTLPDDPAWWGDDVDQTLRDGRFVGHMGLAEAAKGEPLSPPTKVPSLTVHLRVVDGVTNLPISHIRVSPGGSISPDQAFRTLSRSGLELSGGDVTWSFYDGAWAYFLRIEADGYAAAPTRIIKASEKNTDVEVRLSKAMTATIVVRNPDGRAAGGAKAYLATPTIWAHVNAGPDAEPFAVAGADGIIHFSPPGEAYRFAIFDSEGSAEVTATNDGAAVTLTAWASVSISAGSAEAPLAGAVAEPQSFISQDLGCWISWGSNYRTDGAGQMTMSACRPGDLLTTVFAPKNGVDTGWRYLESQCTLKPGEHVKWAVMAGDSKLRAAVTEFPGYQWSYLSINSMGPSVELPVGLNQLPEKQRDSAVRELIKKVHSIEGLDPVRISRIEAMPGADGTIAVTGLVPGTYALGGYARPIDTGFARSPSSQPTQPPALDWYFTIPNSPRASVDLGTVTPPTSDVPALVVGQVVPDLDMKTLEDKPFSLKGCRGRWVLLDFWGTWCGFCIGEEPTLKDAYEGWSKDGRLVMVSASVDDTVEQVRTHVKEKELGWTQLVLGPRDQTKVPEQFGVVGYPSLMLISPEGKLVATDLRGGSVREILMKNLGAAAAAGGGRGGSH